VQINCLFLDSLLLAWVDSSCFYCCSIAENNTNIISDTMFLSSYRIYKSRQFMFMYGSISQPF